MAKRVLLVGFDGADGLDLFGPAEVFAAAGRRLGAPAYDVIVAAVGGGSIALTSGASVAAARLAGHPPARRRHRARRRRRRPRHRRGRRERRALVGWLARAARVVRRIGSVCDGAFIVARAGILDGRRAATHWSSCDRLARLYPKVDVDREAIFVRDGRVWTSAGVTTGIDMALAMVEEDHGRRTRRHRRRAPRALRAPPGFQSQFSEELVAQASASDPLGPVVAWLRANLRAPLDVATAGAPRRHVGALAASSLPAGARHHAGQARREAARRAGANAAGDDAASAPRRSPRAAASASAPRMARAFERALGVAPRAYRTMFASAGPLSWQLLRSLLAESIASCSREMSAGDVPWRRRSPARRCWRGCASSTRSSARAGAKRVLGKLPPEDRRLLGGIILPVGRYPLVLNARLDTAIAEALDPANPQAASSARWAQLRRAELRPVSRHA